jgi:hypothetical protein
MNEPREEPIGLGSVWLDFVSSVVGKLNGGMWEGSKNSGLHSDRKDFLRASRPGFGY